MRLIGRCLRTILALCVLGNVGAIQTYESDSGTNEALKARDKRFSIDEPSWLEDSLARMSVPRNEGSLARMSVPRNEAAPYSQRREESKVEDTVNIPAALYSYVPQKGDDDGSVGEPRRRVWYFGDDQLSRDYDVEEKADEDLSSDVEKRPWGSMFSSPSNRRLSSSILARGFKLGKRPWGSVFNTFGKRPWGSVFSRPVKRPWGSVFSHIGKRPWGSVFSKWNKRDSGGTEELQKRPWGPSFGGAQRGGAQNSLFSSGFKFGKRPWGSVFNWKGGYQGSPKLTKRPWGSVFSGSRHSGPIHLYGSGGNGFKFGKRTDEVVDGDLMVNKRPWGPTFGSNSFGEKTHKRPWGSVFGGNYRIGKRDDV